MTAVCSRGQFFVYTLLVLLVGFGCQPAAEKQAPAATKRESTNQTTSHSPIKDAGLELAAEKSPDDRNCNQLGGSPRRNNAPRAENIPHQWHPGEFASVDEWLPERSVNIKWVARLGTQSYGTPVVAGGRVFVGTNNGAGNLQRYPAKVDLGCLLAFRTKDGSFLWQHSSEKLPTGNAHDWPLQGICSTPLVDEDRLWFVTNRGEVRCLDTDGFLDGQNDGPYKDEPNENKDEADVVWVYDMMEQLGTLQHNMCSCSVTAAGRLLFVNTSNGVDEETHETIPAPDAPSFLAMDRGTGKVVWTDNSPGPNILHGQWSSPAYAVLGGVAQVIFAGGDGWVYSFLAEGESGKAKLLWKFDCNPKQSEWELGGRGDRNNIIGTPVIYGDRVYVAVGQDPEHAEGKGRIWCIDAGKRLDGSDVSPQLVFASEDATQPMPARRLRNFDPEKGEVVRDNPDSAAIWQYESHDQDGDGKIGWEEEMHRTCGSVVIKDDLLFVADFSGLFHCVNAQTGQAWWTHDLFAASWSSPLIADGKVFIGNEDGDVTVFKLAKEKKILSVDDGGKPGPINIGNSIYSTPVVANNVLYIANRTHLYAISAGAKGGQKSKNGSE